MSSVLAECAEPASRCGASQGARSCMLRAYPGPCLSLSARFTASLRLVFFVQLCCPSTAGETQEEGQTTSLQGQKTVEQLVSPFCHDLSDYSGIDF